MVVVGAVVVLVVAAPLPPELGPAVDPALVAEVERWALDALETCPAVPEEVAAEVAVLDPAASTV